MSDDKPPAHERIAGAARAHPWATIVGIAAFAASLASAWPLFVTLSHFYYTAADAQSYHDEVERRLAWGEVRDLRVEATLARNLVNECRIKRSNKDQMSAMESRVCDQYEDELREAQRKFGVAQARALALSGNTK